MKIGIVGNGKIVPVAIEAMIQGNITISSLWCRNKEKGKPIVEKYHIPHQYDDYDQFLQDDSYDTVYIALVNTLHYAYAKQALLAHKHVIVEKPFTIHSKEAKELKELANQNGCMLFEAIISRYSPNYERLKQVIHKVGNIKLIQANYSQYSSRYDAFKDGIVTPTFDPEYYGGALYDLNVYNVHFVVGLFGIPSNIHYFGNDAPNGVDTSGVLVLEYDGFKAVCTGAKDSSSPSFITIQGEDGTIRYPNRPGYIYQGSFTEQKSQDGVSIDVVDGSHPMMDEFLCIQDVIVNHDYECMNAWLTQSIEVISVLETAYQLYSCAA